MVSLDPERVVGREPELAAVRGFIDAPRGALALTGGPGIGKTTLWEAGIELALERGVRVLVVRSGGGEAWLPFAALIDLCDGVDTSALEGLPAPQRHALEVALRRAAPGDVPPEAGAITVGFLNALRALAAATPVLIAIDDVQWLDAPSAEALAFAARRLRDEPVAFLLAKRRGRRTPLERALERRLERLEVGPLGIAGTRTLLAERLGLSLPRPLLRRIAEATVGNPLFALEVGRTLLEDGVPAAGEDLPLPDAVEDLLGTRVGRLDDAPRRLLLATALSPDLHRDEVVALEGASVVEDAVDTGLLRLDGPHVRPSHPLLAAAARKRSRARERRALHQALADVVADEQLRARHLALAADRPDEGLAQTMAAAAQAASARGARHQAVVLAEHALRLTPAPSRSREERLLKLGWYLMQAGELQRLTDLLAPAVESLPTGRLRARGWLLLADGAGPRTIEEGEDLLDRALEEAPDEPSVRSYVLAEKACNQAASGLARIAEAEGWALQALAAAGDDRDLERSARYALGWTRALGGRSLDDLCALSSVASNATTYIVAVPERIAGQRHVWRGELAEARELLERLLALADERGEAASYALVRLHLCELELRAGEWAAAGRRLDEWAQSADGDLLIRPMYERCRALLAAGVGDAREAERWAAHAIARAETVGSRWDWLESERARGMAALLAREPARAVAYLQPAWQHIVRGGIGDPGAFPVAPELVEALVDAGSADEARAVASRVDAVDHPWAAATALRCRALVEPGSEAGLAEAAEAYGRLGLAFDRARCLLSLGRAQRRLKQWGAAREALEGAAAAFDALGSGGWAEVARADLARVGGRRPRASGELTPTEHAVVDLAAEGLANKEIARALNLAVHTVEVHLSRAYRKLGVRSRAQLAARGRA